MGIKDRLSSLGHRVGAGLNSPGSCDDPMRREVVKAGVLGFLAFLTMPLGGCSEYVPDIETDSSGEELKIRDPGLISFAMALGGESLPPELAEEIMHQGLRSSLRVEVSGEGNPTAEVFYLMKGKKFPPSPNSSFLILCDETGKRWLKVAPNQGMTERLIQGMNGLTEELSLPRFEAFRASGIPMPKMRQIEIGGQTFTAVETAYWGRTVAALQLEQASSKELKALYDDAFQVAAELLATKGILTRDPNPGNIAQVVLPDGSTQAFIFDLESSGSAIVRPTPQVMERMQAKFAQWGERLGVKLDLTLPPVARELQLVNTGRTAAGRFYLADGFIDFSFSIVDSALTAEQISLLRNKIAASAETLAQSGQSEVVIDGVLVQLRRMDQQQIDDLLRQSLTKLQVMGQSAEEAAARSIVNATGVNTFLAMLIGTITLPGWNGISLEMRDQLVLAESMPEYRSEEVLPQLLEKQINLFKSQLTAYIRANLVFTGDDWMASVTLPPEVMETMNLVMGMNADNLMKQAQDYHLSSDQLLEYVNRRINNTAIPLPVGFQFASPFPGIEGAKTTLPMWVSSFKDEKGIQQMTLWMRSWEDELNLSSETKRTQVLMPVIQYKNNRLVYADYGRMGMGFEVDESAGNTRRCDMWLRDENGAIVIGCKME